MKAIVLIASIAVASGFAPPASSQGGGAVVATKPGGDGRADRQDHATITAIDPKTRGVTLKGPQGNEVVIVAGPEVKNFAQMKVGDNVDVQYLEALTLEPQEGRRQAGREPRKPRGERSLATGLPVEVGKYRSSPTS